MEAQTFYVKFELYIFNNHQNMRKLFVGLSLLTFLVADAQKKTNPSTFGKSITADDLKRHLYIIAGPEMEGRNTPSPGLERAATYIENQFKSFGLLPGNNGSYRQFYPLYKDSVTGSSLKVNGTSFASNTDYQVNAMTSYNASLRLGEAVFVGYGIVDGDVWNDYKDVNVAGKAVIIANGSPASYKPSTTGFASPANLNAKIRNAQAKGAVAVFVVADNFPRKPIVSAGGYQLNGYAASVYPQVINISEKVAAQIIGADGEGILAKLKAGNAPSKAYKAKIDFAVAKVTKEEQVSNVIGIVEGTDKKDEYVVVTAHYDHDGVRADGVIFYGADDDGSGTVSVIEMAEAFAKAKAAGKGPRRTMVFMTVSGEEKGLWGSEYYGENPVFPLDKTSVNLNIDMIGRIGDEYNVKAKDKDSTNYVYIIGDDKLSTDLAPFTDRANKNVKLKLDRRYNDINDRNRFYYRSDHYNFAKHGVPAIFYFNGVHADYHKVTDTPDKINYPLMAKRAQLVFYTAWEIANSDEMMKRDLKLEIPGR